MPPQLNDDPSAADLYLPSDGTEPSRPIWLTRPSDLEPGMAELSSAQNTWLRAIGFKAQRRRHALVPGPDGTLAGVALGLGDGHERPGIEPAAVLVGLLPAQLPPGSYHLASATDDPTLAAVAWGLGAYRFNRYKSGQTEVLPRLRLPGGADLERVRSIVEALWLGRDLINTPANDLGPQELEAAARRLAERHQARLTSICGDALLDQNFPLIHAVGRASPRAPRLIDVVAGRETAPKVTIIGKGICFDTGGLDIKPASGMLLMKKDMGGAAAAIALAQMILTSRLDVRLRLLIPAAENSVSGNAFRPGDIIRSRSGRMVEIGNTDAEGRLVLADALALADEEAPDFLFTFATLTGAARVALGPELPPYYCDDDRLCQAIEAAGRAVWDPVWRMPLTTPYEGWLDSPVADLNNVAEGGFAGSVVAAIFLKRFVAKARRFAHFDIYGWRPSAGPLGPKGGETQAARAVFATLCREVAG